MATPLPLTSQLSTSCSKSPTFRVLRATYGNGVTQRARDGLNSKRDEWQIMWLPLNSTDEATVVAVLNAVEGVDLISWTPFHEAVSKFFTLKDGYQISYSEGLANISCVLQQEFDPA